MKNKYLPKGRSSLPKELLQFGRHLVYSEGTETEPNYVDNIKRCIAKKYNCRQNDIELVPTAKEEKSYNTMSLVKFAINDVDRRVKQGEQINGVWIMFDKDDFPDFMQAHNTILQMNDSTSYNDDGFKYNTKTSIAWHSCWSNESFELWLCLYFSYYSSANTRKDYITHLEKNTALKDIGFKYKKNQNNIHDIIVENGGSLKFAIKNAKKLEKQNGQNNPSTGVYLFAEYFMPYMN